MVRVTVIWVRVRVRIYRVRVSIFNTEAQMHFSLISMYVHILQEKLLFVSLMPALPVSFGENPTEVFHV